MTAPEGSEMRRKQLKFWKQHSNTYLYFASRAKREAAGFLLYGVAGSTENGGKFDAVISQAGTGRWWSGIKEERVKKGGKAA
jgi:hypothetical protein